MRDKTVEYYNTNAKDFYESTVNVDMSMHYEMFEKYLQPGASLMDCGCGSGRDAKYFLGKGYKVTAIDGSEELCKKASRLCGISVKNMYFQDIDFIQEFDGIWASASLLHVNISELPLVLRKLLYSLKPGGVLYTSFKYGTFSGERNGRVFTDLDEKAFENLLEKFPEFKELEKTISTDMRPGREEEKWLNIVLRKDLTDLESKASKKKYTKAQINNLKERYIDLKDRIIDLGAEFDRHFTLDGHLIGSIGEVMASYYYGIRLLPASCKIHDGIVDGKMVQIKITQGKSVVIKDIPEYLLVLFLEENGDLCEVYNGPGSKAFEVASKQDSYNHHHMQIGRLMDKSKEVSEYQRVEQKKRLNVPKKQSR